MIYILLIIIGMACALMMAPTIMASIWAMFFAFTHFIAPIVIIAACIFGMLYFIIKK